MAIPAPEISAAIKPSISQILSFSGADLKNKKNRNSAAGFLDIL
jgi:hypothetical protein